MKVYQRLAQTLTACFNCYHQENWDWQEEHATTINEIIKNEFPSGSGFDCGCAFDFEKSTVNKLVITTQYHHMDDAGGYDGWTQHTVTVKPDLAFGFTLHISGRDRNDIKDYMHDVFNAALDAEYTETTTLPEDIG